MKFLGFATLVGVALGFGAKRAGLFDGVLREGAVVDLGRLKDNAVAAGGRIRKTLDEASEPLPATPIDAESAK